MLAKVVTSIYFTQNKKTENQNVCQASNFTRYSNNGYIDDSY